MRRGVLEARRGLGSQQGRRSGQGGTENDGFFFGVFLLFFFKVTSPSLSPTRFAVDPESRIRETMRAARPENVLVGESRWM